MFYSLEGVRALAPFVCVRHYGFFSLHSTIGNALLLAGKYDHLQLFTYNQSDIQDNKMTVIFFFLTLLT